MIADRKLTKLNLVMARFGFYKDPDHYLTAKDSLPKRITYVDVPGNGIDVHFVANEAGLDRIDVRFNASEGRSWTDLEELLRDISDAITGWIKESKQPRLLVPLSSPRGPAKFSLGAFLADVKAGMDKGSLMSRHRLTSNGIESMLDKLLRTGRLRPADVTRWHAKSARSGPLVFKCTVCSDVQYARLYHCPLCGGRMARVDEDIPGS